MRVNNDPGAECCECDNTRKTSIEMFDIMISGNKFTLCDVCNEKLFYKTLRASCMVNGKLKQKQDMAVIRNRATCSER